MRRRTRLKFKAKKINGIKKIRSKTDCFFMIGILKNFNDVCPSKIKTDSVIIPKKIV